MRRVIRLLAYWLLPCLLLAACGSESGTPRAASDGGDAGSPSGVSILQGEDRPKTLLGLAELTGTYMDRLDAMQAAPPTSKEAYLARSASKIFEIAAMLKITKSGTRVAHGALEESLDHVRGIFHLPLADWIRARASDSPPGDLETPIGTIPGDTGNSHRAFMQLILEKTQPALARKLESGALDSALGHLFRTCGHEYVVGCPDGALTELPGGGAAIDMQQYWETAPEAIGTFMTGLSAVFMAYDAIDALYDRLAGQAKIFNRLSRQVVGTTLDETLKAWWAGEIVDSLAPWRPHVAKYDPDMLVHMGGFATLLQRERLKDLAEDIASAFVSLRQGNVSPADLADDPRTQPYGFNAMGGAFFAVPRHFPHVGRMTYLADAKGNLWIKDTRGKRVATIPADPEAAGWALKRSADDAGSGLGARYDRYDGEEDDK